MADSDFSAALKALQTHLDSQIEAFNNALKESISSVNSRFAKLHSPSSPISLQLQASTTVPSSPLTPSNIPAISLIPQPITSTQTTFDDVLKKLEIAMSASAISKFENGLDTPADQTPSFEPLSEDLVLPPSDDLDELVCCTIVPTAPFYFPPLLRQPNSHLRLPVYEPRCFFSPPWNVTARRGKTPALAPSRCLKIVLTKPILRIFFGPSVNSWREEPPGFFVRVQECINKKLSVEEMEYFPECSNDLGCVSMEKLRLYHILQDARGLHYRLPECLFSPSLNITSSQAKSEEDTTTPALRSPVLARPRCLQWFLYERAIFKWIEEPPGNEHLDVVRAGFSGTECVYQSDFSGDTSVELNFTYLDWCDLWFQRGPNQFLSFNSSCGDKLLYVVPPVKHYGVVPYFFNGFDVLCQHLDEENAWYIGGTLSDNGGANHNLQWLPVGFTSYPLPQVFTTDIEPYTSMLSILWIAEPWGVTISCNISGASCVLNALSYAKLATLFTWVFDDHMVAASISHSLASYVVTVLVLIPCFQYNISSWVFGALSINILAHGPLVLLTRVLVRGVIESALLNSTMTMTRDFIVVLVIIVGAFEVDVPNWILITSNGVELILFGATVVFFSHVGFDAVVKLVERSKRPQRDLPLGITRSLMLWCGCWTFNNASRWSFCSVTTISWVWKGRITASYCCQSILQTTYPGSFSKMGYSIVSACVSIQFDILLFSQLHYEAWVRFVVLGLITFGVYSFYGQHHAYFISIIPAFYLFGLSRLFVVEFCMLNARRMALYGYKKDGFLSKVPIVRGQIHLINDAVIAEQAAEDYEFIIRQLAKTHVFCVFETNDCPKFDLIFLGMGPDNHATSPFLIHSVSNVLNSSSNIAIVVIGTSKAEEAHLAINEASPDYPTWPARMVQSINVKYAPLRATHPLQELRGDHHLEDKVVFKAWGNDMPPNLDMDRRAQ